MTGLFHVWCPPQREDGSGACRSHSQQQNVSCQYVHYSQKPQEALNLFRYRGALLSTLLHAISYRGALLSTLLQATVYMFSYNLLNVLIQIANKTGLEKSMHIIFMNKAYFYNIYMRPLQEFPDFFHSVLTISHNTDSTEITASNSYFIVAFIVVSTGYLLPSPYLATAFSYGSTTLASRRHVTLNSKILMGDIQTHREVIS
jgi:hypothetical protein